MPRIVRFHQLGGADVLKLDDLPVPEAGAGEVVLRVHAFGLNRAEIMFRRGEYPQYQPVLPSAIGYEAAGEVMAVGPGVGAVAIGDRVSTIPSFKMGRYWTYGEYARVPEHALAPLAAGFSWTEGAAIWMPFMTAYGGLLEYGRLAPGDHIVIRAASSSVGLAAIQIANSVGAKAIAVTRDASKVPFIQRQGPAHVITSGDGRMAERILQITDGRGAEMVFDPIAGTEIAELCRATAYQGRVFVYGRLSAEPCIFPVGTALARGITVRGYSMFEVVNFLPVFERVKIGIIAGLASGAFRPVVGAVFGLPEIVKAHEYMESNVQQGKIVVTP